MLAADLEGFLVHIRENRVTRKDGEQLIGRDELTRLLAAGVVAFNPFTERLEKGGTTEDFYP